MTQRYYNQAGGGTTPPAGKGKIDPALVAQAATELLKLRTAMAQKKQQRDALLAETGCKKPMINVGKAKKNYLDCLAKHRDKVAASEAADRELKKMELEINKLELTTGAAGGAADADMTKKIMLYVGIGLAVAAVITTIIVVIRRRKK